MSTNGASIGGALMTAVDAARILGLSADMVRLLARAGRLPAAAETVRGIRLFRREDVEALAAERAGVRAHYHIVQFYEDHDFLCRAVADFLADGLKARGPIIVFASEANREALRERLSQHGIDVQRACASGQAVLLDARETLDRFMGDDLPDASLFRQHVGSVVEQRSNASRLRVRVYGEMVDLLSKDGHRDAAIRFEELWNDFARAHRLSRLCAYAIDHFRTGADSAAFQRLCELHTRVVPTEGYRENADPQTRLRQIAILQQRAHALDSEMAQRKRAEDELRAVREQHRADSDASTRGARR